MDKIHKIKKKLCRIRDSVVQRRAKKSFSQTGEDRIIDYAFSRMGIKSPSYVDIGSYDPVYLSNTYLFYTRGSKGVCVEPNPAQFKKIRRIRPRDNAINAGVVGKRSESNKSLTLFVTDPPKMSTFSKEAISEYAKKTLITVTKKVDIQTIPINKLLDQCRPEIDLLSLDVEGMDCEIIKNIDFRRFNPKIICVETIKSTKIPSSKIQEKDYLIINYLKGKNYFVFADTYLNTILINKDAWKNA